jgi:hypothetical protein
VLLLQVALLLAHAYAFTVNPFFGGIALIRRVIYAYHATLAHNPRWTGTRLLDFAYRGTRHTYPWAISAFFGWVALVPRVVNALHSSRTLDPAGAGTRLLRRR